MASKLSSILVKLGLIPIRKLDQAFQNQVINGGTLDSALLELGLIREKDLVRVLVEASELPSIQLAELTLDDSRELVSIFPQKLALRYQVIPVARVGEQVGVLVNAEFDKNKIEEIGFMLGVSLVARVVPEPRLLSFASRIYGFELDPRQTRILAKLGAAIPYPETYVKPWVAVQPQEASVEAEPEPPPQAATLIAPLPGEDSAQVAPPAEDATPVPSFNYVERQVSPQVLVPTITRERITGEQARATSAPKTSAEAERPEGSEEEDEDGVHDAVTRPGFTFPEHRQRRSPFSESGPIGPLPEGLPSVHDDTAGRSDTGTIRQVAEAHEDDGSATSPAGVPTPRLEEAMTEPMELSEPLPVRAERLPSDTTQTDAIPDFQSPGPVAPVAAMPIPSFPAEPRVARPTGSSEALVSFDGSAISMNQFTDMLVSATSRDDVLIAYLKYCANYAQYLFLFTVEGEAATGRFAIYRGQVDQHKVLKYLISLTFDSVLQKAAQNIPTFGVYSPSDGNQFLLDHLSLGPPVHIMALPVTVGSRIVALVLGTHQLAQSPMSMGELVAASGLLSQALLRLIKQKKKDRRSAKALELSPTPELSPVPEEEGADPVILSPVPRETPASTPYTAVTVPIPTRLEQQNSFVEEIIALIDQLEHLSLQQDTLDPRSAQALRNLGDKTLEVLHFYFPGILTYRSDQDLALAPPPSAHGPLLRFMAEWGLPVVPVLIDLLDSENPQIRLYATFLFYEIRFPDILVRIAEKLFDPEPSVRAAAARVILSYEGHREYAEITSNLRGLLGHPDPGMQKNTVEALGRLRDKLAIEPILSLLHNAHIEVIPNMIRALRQITLRDFGNQTERWQSWWALNAQRHRVLWLIEGLRQNDEELRQDALRELVRIVGETMDYDAAASMEQREAGVRRWINWWEAKGRVQLI